MNSDRHADVQVFLQQLQRARDAGDIKIFYGEIPSNRRVANPSSKEEVFRMMEDDDRQLADLMQRESTDHLDMLRGGPGERAIYDRSSATCNLYANNVLGHLQSRRDYVHLLTEDLQRQGITFINRLNTMAGPGAGARESVLCAAEERVDESEDQWRERHLVSFEDFEKIQQMLSSPLGGVSSQDVLRYEIFVAAVYRYGIQYNKVDRDFVEGYVQGQKAKSLMTKFENYERSVLLPHPCTCTHL